MLFARASRRFGIFGMSLVLLSSMISPIVAWADTGTCTANIDTHSISPVSSNLVNLTVRNNSSVTIAWVDITFPGPQFFYTGNNISGWSVQGRTNGMMASGGSISPGGSHVFQIAVNADVYRAASENWVVKADQQAHFENAPSLGSGSGPDTCTGSLGMSVSGNPPQDNDTNVSGVAATSIGQNSATIVWNSDFDTSSLVYYGKSTSYSSTSSYDETRTASHSVRLTGLTAGTVYHYQVIGSDGNGGNAYSVDNTFLTQSAPVTPGKKPTTNKGATTTIQPTTNTGVRVAYSKQPPKLSLRARFAGVYKTAPTVTGNVSAANPISKIEYSTDSGVNWLPAVVALSGANVASFRFTPLLPLDGNYDVIVRVIDAAGNTTASKPQTVVIDSAPPSVGAIVVSIGPQLLMPDTNGVVRAAQDLDERVTVNAGGGATQVTLEAKKVGSSKVAQSFSLTQASDTGLWHGAVSFHQPGTYSLTAHAMDGAGNKTSRVMNNVQVAQAARVVDVKRWTPLPATLEVFYRDPETAAWVSWDGESYGQRNPMKVSAKGSFGLYLPAGTYYLKASAPGYQTTLTKSFTLDKPTVISNQISLRHRPELRLKLVTIRLPWFNLQQTPVQVSASGKTVGAGQLKSVPQFTDITSDGKPLSTTDLYGKPTIITFFNTWTPSAQDQVAQLSRLRQADINRLAIDVGDSSSKLGAYMAIAGYDVPAIADDQNQLAAKFNVSTVPVMFFADRSGRIKEVYTGQLTDKELLQHVAL